MNQQSETRAVKKTTFLRRVFFTTSVLIFFTAIVILFRWQQIQQQNIAQLSEDIKNLQTGLAKTQDTLYTQQTQQKKWQKVLMESEEVWQLQEIEHMLRIADISLHYQHDLPLAMHLLQLANQQLLTLSKQQISGLLSSIEQLEQQLQQLPAIDVSARLSELAKLSDQVSTLAWLATTAKKHSSEQNDIQDDEPRSRWRSAMKKSWQQLQKIVVIRHHDRSYMAELNQQDRVYINQYLQLLLVQARWAVLQQQPQLFQDSLQQAQAWLQRYYLTDDRGVQQFSEHLQQLQASYANVDYPSFIPIIQQVSHVIDELSTS